ncbi:MAG: AAA family ATPase [Candidatus Poribacteria bacterium]
MSYTIAVAGKGGTGKTTIASLIIAQLLSEKNGSILAVDADPNSTLNEALGVKLECTLGDAREEMLKHKYDLPGGMDKHRYMQYRLQTCLVEEKGYDLLAMGRTEGPDCYCYVNNLLRGIMDEFSSNYEYIVMDNEAGMEHLSRRTTRNVDLLLVVSDESVIGVRTAGRIYQMTKGLELNLGDSYLIINRAHESLPEPVVAEVEETDVKLLGTVPADENIVEYELAGKSLLSLPDDSPARVAVQELLNIAREKGS